MRNVIKRVGKRAVLVGTVGVAAVGAAVFGLLKLRKRKTDVDISNVVYPEIPTLNELDHRIYELSQEYLPEAIELLKELIRLPQDHLGEDPECGTSGHEGPRIEFLKNKIIELDAVATPNDVDIDEFGNLIWRVIDRSDATPLNDRKTVYLVSRCDTRKADADDWTSILGTGIDAYNGLTDDSQVDEEELRTQLGFVPDKSKWNSLIFGRGSCDQLAGLVAQVFATKILVETLDMGCLKGSIVIAVASVSGMASDGCAINHILKRREIEIWQVPDCVILSQCTGDIHAGPCGLCIAQAGHCQVEVEISGKGSKLNAFEYGSLIISEAAEGAKKLPKFMGQESREVIWTRFEPSRDALTLPKFTFRFSRRATLGEDSMAILKEVHSIKSLHRARENGMNVNVSIPRYVGTSWKGMTTANDLDCPMWVTNSDNPVIMAALESYGRVIAPHISGTGSKAEDLTSNPRISYFAGSTEGAGFVMAREQVKFDFMKKHWLTSVAGDIHPPMIGFGAGYEQHAGKLGEYVPQDQLWVPIAMMARFPKIYVKARPNLV